MAVDVYARPGEGMLRMRGFARNSPTGFGDRIARQRWGDAMIATHVQRFYIASHSPTTSREREGDWMERIVRRARQVLCGMGGHARLLHFDGDHMSLRCLVCGAQTPGWTIDVRPQFRHPVRRRARVLHRAA